MASKSWFAVVKVIGDAAKPGAVKWLSWNGGAWVEAAIGKFYVTKREAETVMIGLVLSEPESFIGLWAART